MWHCIDKERGDESFIEVESFMDPNIWICWKLEDEIPIETTLGPICCKYGYSFMGVTYSWIILLPNII
jgi:hypothetical protein